MAPSQTDKKRPRSSKIGHDNPKKRQKTGQNGSAKVSKSQKGKTARGNPVPIDSLQWKDVEMPDRLDDYEGFYGLEEIDDVAVEREDGGTVKFRSLNPQNEEQGNNKGTEDSDTKKESDGVPEEYDEEWVGFSEEDDAGEDDIRDVSAGSKQPQRDEAQKGDISKKAQKNGDDSGEANKADKKKKKKDKKKQEKQEKQKPNSTQTEGLTEGAFEGLEDDNAENEADVAAWAPMDLSQDSMLALSKLGFSQPTPIQSSAIPEVVAGHDVIGKASTGSGKTLAYGIPIVEHYLATHADQENGNGPSEQRPTALILSPTRELAHQIGDHIKRFCTNANLDRPSIATLTGGLSIQKQQRILEYGDIVVATPGRLWEIISSGHGVMKKLKQIKFLVVDEADRLLSEGNFKELEQILSALDKKETYEDAEQAVQEEAQTERQTLVYSATFHKDLQQKLAGKTRPGGDLMSKQESMAYLLKKLKFREEKPKFIDMNPISQMATGLKEGLVECEGTEKDLYLYALLLFHPNKRTLIFTNSISAVRRLTPFLQNLNLKVFGLHSNMPQKARLRSVERFSAQAGSILVATDVAARGLDIPGVQTVIHYHLPRAADMYVHRSGRTARAETVGSSILICAPNEVQGVRRLVAKVHARGGASEQSKFFIRTLDVDRRIVSRLKPRTSLAKQLADTNIAKEKKHSSDDFFKAAAEELGVEYDSDELDQAPGRHGRGNKRKQKERDARTLTKDEVKGMRAELNSLLKQRVNVGVSERYLTSGRVDVDALLANENGSEFLGQVDGLASFEG